MFGGKLEVEEIGSHRRLLARKIGCRQSDWPAWALDSMDAPAPELAEKPMWKRLWREWTIDKPAALGDWLHQVLVVELAALLDRLTPRRAIALVPFTILIIAYSHSIPLPPELMLLGDVLAYLDIVSILLLVSLLARISTILYVIRQTANRVLRLISLARSWLRRPDSRRQRRVAGNKKRPAADASNEDDDVPAFGFAWA